MVFKSHPPRSERDWLMPSEAASDLEISPKTLTKWAIKGKIPHTRTLGGHRRYAEVDVKRLADKITQERTEELARDSILRRRTHERSSL